MRVLFMLLLILIAIAAGMTALHPRQYREWHTKVFHVPAEWVQNQTNDGERRVAAIVILVVSLVILFMQLR